MRVNKTANTDYIPAGDNPDSARRTLRITSGYQARTKHPDEAAPITRNYMDERKSNRYVTGQGDCYTYNGRGHA